MKLVEQGIEHKPKWVRNRGVNKAPSQPGRAIEVRFRTGDVAWCPADGVDTMFWTHMKCAGDIMAWRYV